MNFNYFKVIAQKNKEMAIRQDLINDNNRLARDVYREVFPFYDSKTFSGDVVFTWKSQSLVKGGYYKGKRDSVVKNNHFIGNLFPNYKTDKKHSLNTNRNGMMGNVLQ